MFQWRRERLLGHIQMALKSLHCRQHHSLWTAGDPKPRFLSVDNKPFEQSLVNNEPISAPCLREKTWYSLRVAALRPASCATVWVEFQVCAWNPDHGRSTWHWITVQSLIQYVYDPHRGVYSDRRSAILLHSAADRHSETALGFCMQSIHGLAPPNLLVVGQKSDKKISQRVMLKSALYRDFMSVLQINIQYVYLAWFMKGSVQSVPYRPRCPRHSRGILRHLLPHVVKGYPYRDGTSFIKTIKARLGQAWTNYSRLQTDEYPIPMCNWSRDY